MVWKVSRSEAGSHCSKYMEKFRWPEKFLAIGGSIVAVQDKPRESTHKQPTQER